MDCCRAQRNKHPENDLPGLPGRRMTSGFDWHDADCPTIPGGVLSREARDRIQAKMEEWDDCMRRAAASARTYVIG